MSVFVENSGNSRKREMRLKEDAHYAKVGSFCISDTIAHSVGNTISLDQTAVISRSKQPARRERLFSTACCNIHWANTSTKGSLRVLSFFFFFLFFLFCFVYHYCCSLKRVKKCDTIAALIVSIKEE